MSTRQRRLTIAEIRGAFEGAGPPPILSPQQLGKAIGISPKTIYQWIAQGRFDGTFRHRGKHIRLWRDRAIQLFFNGPDWNERSNRSNSRRRTSDHSSPGKEKHLRGGLLVGKQTP